ncbi:OmpH family outer membrane protein [Rhodovulum sp. DZ06]|uniref:OmpH family outer membrane protein n=1 Tax=Rhodovulum sp. DZ06 TaxID=3425126 RepID=UPI003D338F7E
MARRGSFLRRPAAGLRAAGAALALGAGLAAAALPSPAPAQARAQILVVDVSRVLAASDAARALAEAETRARAAVQSRLDRVKEELEAEERALAQARETMDPAEFAKRGAAFDRRVRQERRAAQERGALLLKFVEDGRDALRERLPMALEELRRRRGASVVLDAAAVAAWDADLDATAAAAEIFDEMMGEIAFTPPQKLFEP